MPLSSFIARLKKLPPRFTDRLLKGLFFFGLCFLFFVIGAGALHYRLPVVTPLAEAFRGGETWYKTWREASRKEENKKTKKAEEPRAAAGKAKWDPKKAQPGYTLISMGNTQNAFLVDMEGKKIFQWEMPFRKAWPNPSHVHAVAKARKFMETVAVYPNGDLLAQFTGLGDTPYGYGLVKMDKQSNVLWTYEGNAHHDFHINQKNGEILALTHEMIKRPPKGLEGLPYPMLVDYVARLSPEGKELDKISILEAFKDSPHELMIYRRSKRLKWDHLHANTVTVLEPEIAAKFPQFKAGQILVCLRSIPALVVIDPDTRKVVWAYSGPWKLPHASKFLPNGNLMVLDNMGHIVDGKAYSRVIEFDPQTLAVEWQYAGNAKNPFRTSTNGRLQRLENGNTLVALSRTARVVEITPQGETVWTYNRPGQGWLVTAHRYSEKELPFLRKQ